MSTPVPILVPNERRRTATCSRTVWNVQHNSTVGTFLQKVTEEDTKRIRLVALNSSSVQVLQLVLHILLHRLPVELHVNGTARVFRPVPAPGTLATVGRSAPCQNGNRKKGIEVLQTAEDNSRNECHKFRQQPKKERMRSVDRMKVLLKGLKTTECIDYLIYIYTR